MHHLPLGSRWADNKFFNNLAGGAAVSDQHGYFALALRELWRVLGAGDGRWPRAGQVALGPAANAYTTCHSTSHGSLRIIAASAVPLSWLCMSQRPWHSFMAKYRSVFVARHQDWTEPQRRVRCTPTGYGWVGLCSLPTEGTIGSMVAVLIDRVALGASNPQEQASVVTSDCRRARDLRSHRARRCAHLQDIAPAERPPNTGLTDDTSTCLVQVR